MEDKTIITYSLLTHLKETKFSKYSSIAEIFFPIVKKAIVEYSKEKGNTEVKGRNISEIQSKIIDFFGIEIPLGVLDFILKQINKEIDDDNVFTYYKDQSFVINTFVFNDIDEDISNEKQNIEILKEDYQNYCKSLNVSANFDELVQFICSQKTELFSNKEIKNLDVPYHIPKYINQKFKDDDIFKLISDVYLGSIISSYFTYKIESPVANTELLIDTNYFISLVNLNTHEAYTTCNYLHDLCKRLGYRFTILFSTVDQIKALLSTRIQDFANKEIGLVKEADIFGACIRRNLSKSDLERIKDSINTILSDNNINLIHEAQLKQLIDNAKKSDKYKEILEIREGQKLSALNDTIAFHYVNKNRGNNVQEFSDVKCWFLNNSFHQDYFASKGYKLHNRYKISANELLSLLWLSNPSQVNLNETLLSMGGLSSYIAKYKNQKVPSIQTIKEINSRSKKAVELGVLNEKDVFSISVRMAEGQLTGAEAEEMNSLPDEEFIKNVKERTKKDEELISRMDAQAEMIQTQNRNLEEIKSQNEEFQRKINTEKFEREKDRYIQTKLLSKTLAMNKASWGYILFVIIISSFWLVNYLELKYIGNKLGGIIAFSLFLALLFLRLVDHKSVWKCIKFTFLKNERAHLLEEFKEQYANEFEEKKRETKVYLKEEQLKPSP